MTANVRLVIAPLCLALHAGPGTAAEGAPPRVVNRRVEVGRSQAGGAAE